MAQRTHITKDILRHLPPALHTPKTHPVARIGKLEVLAADRKEPSTVNKEGEGSGRSSPCGNDPASSGCVKLGARDRVVDVCECGIVQKNELRLRKMSGGVENNKDYP